jgi:hypothetical protein
MDKINLAVKRDGVDAGYLGDTPKRHFIRERQQNSLVLMGNSLLFERSAPSSKRLIAGTAPKPRCAGGCLAKMIVSAGRLNRDRMVGTAQYGTAYRSVRGNGPDEPRGLLCYGSIAFDRKFLFAEQAQKRRAIL